VRDGDLELIAAPLDFVGVNNYSRTVVSASAEGGATVEGPAHDAPTTAMGWEIYPDGLYELLTRLHREYGVQCLYVTENGAAFDDVPGGDGRIDDRDRIAYLDRYLGAVARAIDEGVPVRGYFVWSLLDNFEWAEGYAARFGIVYVDYPTQERIPKASFRWYRDLIASGRLPQLEPAG
jgi:beta-glucosidase